jgi:hypothetical protein
MSDDQTPEKTVKVPVKLLQEMESRMNKLEKDNAILKKSVSKAKLAKATPEDEKGVTIRVTTYIKDGETEPMLVTKWDNLVKDNVRYSRGNEIEDQIKRFYLEDDTKIECELREFDSITQKVEVELDLDKTVYNRDKSLKECVFEWKGEEMRILPTFIN